MFANYVCYDNKFYEEDQPIFRLNRAMKFGDGVFETIRVISGKTKFLEFHLERMQKGLKALEISCTKGDIEVLKVCIEQLLIKNEIERGAILRIIAQRAGLGKYTPESNKVFFYLETERISEEFYSLNSKGLSLGVCQKVAIYPNQFSGFKTLNSLTYVMASKERAESSFDELVLLNHEGSIAEATSSNIFLVKGKTVFTPHLKEGGVSGIMRRVIINHLKREGFEVVETVLSLDDLTKAEEVFMTNSNTGIRWVGSYNSKRYFKKVSERLINLL